MGIFENMNFHTCRSWKPELINVIATETNANLKMWTSTSVKNQILQKISIIVVTAKLPYRIKIGVREQMN